MVKKKPAFPFTRLAGQEDMKLALLLNVVDPSIGARGILCNFGVGLLADPIHFFHPLADLHLPVEPRFCRRLAAAPL